MYDQYGEAGVNGAAGGGPGGMNWEDIMRQGGFAGGGQGVEFDLGDIFSEFFGGGGRRGQKQQQRGSDIQMDLTMTFKEAAFGLKKTLNVLKGSTCSTCSGNGAKPGTPIKECTTCKGAGVVEQLQRSVFGAVRSHVACEACKGRGKTVETACETCHGKGVERKDTALEVDIPAGIDDGQTIRITGQGEAGEFGAQSGDLFVTVHVKSHDGWERDGDNIYSETEIPFATLVMGGTIIVDTLDGKMEVKVPSGTGSGKQLRLRGTGVTRLHGGGRGDHIITVQVEVPKKVSSKYKKILKQLSELD